MSLSAYHRARLLMLCGLVVSAVVFTFASRLFHVPTFVHFGGSLLADASPMTSFIVVGVTLLAAVLLSTLIAGTIRFDAGLFCATAGMSALSMRSGRMGDVLRESAQSPSPVIFVHLALELVALYALVAVAWSMLWGLHTNGYLKADEFRDGVEDTDEPVIFKASALAMQVGVMAVCMMLLAQTDMKAQVIASVAVSAFVGACAAYYMYPISPSPWLWIGPMIVGAIGYALMYFKHDPSDTAWKVGQITSWTAPLARPLPLDYATAGPAGAILGYWMSRRWHRERLAETAPPQTSAQEQGQ
jgi:hypothetical protein